MNIEGQNWDLGDAYMRIGKKELDGMQKKKMRDAYVRIGKKRESGHIVINQSVTPICG